MVSTGLAYAERRAMAKARHSPLSPDEREELTRLRQQVGGLDALLLRLGVGFNHEADRLEVLMRSIREPPWLGRMEKLATRLAELEAERLKLRGMTRAKLYSVIRAALNDLFDESTDNQLARHFVPMHALRHVVETLVLRFGLDPEEQPDWVAVDTPRLVLRRPPAVRRVARGAELVSGFSEPRCPGCGAPLLSRIGLSRGGITWVTPHPCGACSVKPQLLAERPEPSGQDAELRRYRYEPRCPGCGDRLLSEAELRENPHLITPPFCSICVSQG